MPLLNITGFHSKISFFCIIVEETYPYWTSALQWYQINQCSNYTDSFSYIITRNGDNFCESGCVDPTGTSPAKGDEEHTNGQTMHENNRQLLACKDKQRTSSWGCFSGGAGQGGLKRWEAAEGFGEQSGAERAHLSSSRGSLFCIGRVPKGKGLTRPHLSLRHQSLLLLI